MQDRQVKANGFGLNLYFKIFIGVELIYHVALVSGVQCGDSVIFIHTHMPSLFKTLWGITECYVELPVLYSRFLLVVCSCRVCMSVPISRFIPLPLTPWWPKVCFPQLQLYSYFANKFICTPLPPFFFFF